ncbi:MAG: hypothetical protein OD918_09505 [Gammaproteobacteria bacterium]
MSRPVSRPRPRSVAPSSPTRRSINIGARRYLAQPFVEIRDPARLSAAELAGLRTRFTQRVNADAAPE